ncbi:MAG: succinate-semialdehyde dehydrogenase, partial [Gammaproteobacteria bacterium]|nr:succinate-semialdehyde dehydrogenase [Gammaproteobacteria bacterium]
IRCRGRKNKSKGLNMLLKNSALFRQQNYINGRWVEAGNKAVLTVVNPFDQSRLGSIPNCTAKDAKIAIEAASEAFSAWQTKTAQERSTILFKWAELIEANLEDLARMITLEGGKPLAESRTEAQYATSFIRWFAEEAKRVYGDVLQPNKPGHHPIVIKQAVGVVAAITPWNFPAAMITRKVAPALAAGCTVVIKPSELTPYTALALTHLAEQAGFPAGVINVITGQAGDIGAELCANPLVRKLSFTGSTQVGRLLMQQCAPTLKKLSLELGGNAPFIIFDDADIEAAVQGLMAAKFRNAGQTCICPNRVLVQAKVYDAFLSKLQPAVLKLKVGSGLDENNNVGPLINQSGVDKVVRLVRDAINKGATLVCGGELSSESSYCYLPTILTDVPDNAELLEQEIFGPIIAIKKFETEQEAVELANATQYGLAAYFYARDIGRVWRVAEKLEYGLVAINEGVFSHASTPFGGVKQSGFGKEGSKYGIEEYLQMKYLCIQS